MFPTNIPTIREMNAKQKQSHFAITSKLAKANGVMFSLGKCQYEDRIIARLHIKAAGLSGTLCTND